MSAREREGSRDAVRRALRRGAARLAPFGYRTDDAEFILAAALAGGYFVRRQFRTYVGCRTGSRETSMLRRAAANRHVQPVVGKSLYRVSRASLRQMVGDETVVPAQGRAWRAVRKALLTLDYMIEAGPCGNWLLSESDKVRYFASLGIPQERFPATARNRRGNPRPFPDALPIQVGSGECPRISFTYAHAGSSGTGVLRHLSLHEALASELSARDRVCEWVVLADSPGQFPQLRAAWRRWRAGLLRDWSEREYFELRRVVESRRWADLSGSAVDRYADLRGEYTGEAVERRYARWLEDGCPGLEPGADFARTCRYREFLLDRDYSIAERVER